MSSDLVQARSAPKTWTERKADLETLGIDPHGQLGEELRLKTAPERAEWRRLLVAQALGVESAEVSEDARRGAALLALIDGCGLGGRRGLEGAGTIRIPQLQGLPSKQAKSGPAWTAEIHAWAEGAQGLYLRPILTYEDGSLHAGIALLAGGERLDLAGGTRRALVGLASLPALPEEANPIAGHEMPAAWVRVVALRAGMALLEGVPCLEQARLAPEDLLIWSALAELCALIGEDGPTYGCWVPPRPASETAPLTLEGVQHLLHEHKPAGTAADDDGLN